MLTHARAGAHTPSWSLFQGDRQGAQWLRTHLGSQNAWMQVLALRRLSCEILGMCLTWLSPRFFLHKMESDSGLYGLGGRKLKGVNTSTALRVRCLASSQCSVNITFNFITKALGVIKVGSHPERNPSDTSFMKPPTLCSRLWVEPERVVPSYSRVGGRTYQPSKMMIQ